MTQRGGYLGSLESGSKYSSNSTTVFDTCTDRRQVLYLVFVYLQIILYPIYIILYYIVPHQTTDYTRLCFAAPGLYFLKMPNYLENLSKMF